MESWVVSNGWEAYGSPPDILTCLLTQLFNAMRRIGHAQAFSTSFSFLPIFQVRTRIFPWLLLLVFAPVDVHQVNLGLPLFFLPWGFHFSVCLVTLSFGLRNVWPIQPHLRRRICTSTLSYPVFSHSSSVVNEILKRVCYCLGHFPDFHLIESIDRRHLLTKFLNVCVIAMVIFHILQP